MLRRSCHGMGHRARPARLGLLGVLSLALAGVVRADDQPAGEIVEPRTGGAREQLDPSIVQALRDRRGAAVVLDFRARRSQAGSARPVVVFLHGWFAVNPGFYGAWIDHLGARRQDRDLSPLSE